MKTKKIGKVVFEKEGYKVVPLYKSEKPSGKYAIVAGKNPVSDEMSMKAAIELLESGNFKPKEKSKNK